MQLALFSGMKRAEIGNAAIAAAWQGAAQDVYAVYAAIVNNLEGRQAIDVQAREGPATVNTVVVLTQ